MALEIITFFQRAVWFSKCALYSETRSTRNEEDALRRRAMRRQGHLRCDRDDAPYELYLVLKLRVLRITQIVPGTFVPSEEFPQRAVDCGYITPYGLHKSTSVVYNCDRVSLLVCG